MCSALVGLGNHDQDDHLSHLFIVISLCVSVNTLIFQNQESPLHVLRILDQNFM